MEIDKNLIGKLPNKAIVINDKLTDKAECDTYEHMDNGVSVPMCPNDSREELEADVWALTTKWKSYKGNFMKLYSSVAYAQIKELLNRQADISWNKAWKVQKDLIAVMQDEIEYLRMVCQKQADSFAAIENENAALRSKLNRIRELAERLQDA